MIVDDGGCGLKVFDLVVGVGFDECLVDFDVGDFGVWF